MVEKNNKSKARPSHDKDKIADIIKKVLNTGIEAANLTEDVVKGVFQGAKTTKEEFLGSVKNGVTEYLNHLDFRKELNKILENYDFEIQTKISLKKKNSSSDN